MTSIPGSLKWSKKDYRQLRKHYDEAVKQDKKMFIFHEREVLTAYAKYLLEYLEEKFK